MSTEEQAAACGLLRALGEELGPLGPELAAAFRRVPRHMFLPREVWLDEEGDWVSCARDAEPARWLAAAYADAPVVTQVNDGEKARDGEVWPSSSASAPSIVFRMLRMLGPRPGDRILEIGTGTGWTAGLLAALLGDENVTTVDVDPALTEAAVRSLKALGLRPAVATADGAGGFPSSAPYDRIIATCSVRRLPYAWVEQTRPGGIVLTPWETPWFCYGLLRLHVGGDGVASGRFAPHSAFMLMRGQRTDLRIYRDVVRDEHIPKESATGLDPWLVAGADADARFAVGLRLPDVWHAWHHRPDVPGVATRLWLATTDATSWAAVDWDGTPDAREYTVWQYGDRRLWDEAEAAYKWWAGQGRPPVGRFGLTVTPDGGRAWLDDPSRSWVL
ncbi:methyltransferase domain-containing protein [Streptomyces achromogenes]|uniref:methyltransferase domain-containing protein n=1 Tax=Streptomyces achromogenes TaxID=67255 RepID=UPI00368DE460